MANFRIYNDTLCPDLWDTAMHLDPKARMTLLRLAYDFYRKTMFPAPVIDVYLMGSIANYNWTADSDVDVHVMIDYSKLQMPPETANKAVKTAGAQWNAEHEVTVKDFKVEMNIQNATEQKPYVTGVYSLVKDQWIRKPFQMPLRIDKNVLKFQYNTMKQYLQNAISSGNGEQMKATKKYLDAYRQYGLDTFGELSYENIIFKILRSRGIIKQLKDTITAVYDQEMTVTEEDEFHPDHMRGIKNLPQAEELVEKLTYWDIAKAINMAHGNPIMAAGYAAYWAYYKDKDPEFVSWKWIKRDLMRLLRTYTGKNNLFFVVYVLCRNRVNAQLEKQVDEVGDQEMSVTETEKIPSKDWGDYDDDIKHQGGKETYDWGKKLKGAYYPSTGKSFFMDRHGGWHYVDAHCHSGWAHKYLQMNNISCDTSPDEVPNEIYYHGFVHIRIHDDCIFFFTYGKITPKQEKEIKDTAIEHGWKVRDALNNKMIDINEVGDKEMTVKESDYIGSTFSGKAKGAPVANALGTVHGEHDMISGVNSQNWRYLERKNKVLWNTKPSPEDVGEVTQWLLKQGVKNPIHKVMHKEGVTEVGEKDIKQTLPNLNVADNPEMGDLRFDRSYWDKMDKETGFFRIQRLTMDELNALREKEVRAVAYCQGNESPAHETLHRKLFARYDNEINRRKRKINAPVTEGFGAGIPEDDRLKIKNTDGSTRRWQIRSKNAPKTPKMTAEIVAAIPESDFEEGQPLPPMK